jgi:hypothetical protein
MYAAFRSAKRLSVSQFFGGLGTMLDNKAFYYINDYLHELMSTNDITQSDFDLVNYALKRQGVDLKDSTTWEVL